MTTSSTYTSRIRHNALLPMLFAFIAKQYKAWKTARRAARADELTWQVALQDARAMADLSRAMTAAASKR